MPLDASSNVDAAYTFAAVHREIHLSEDVLFQKLGNEAMLLHLRTKM